MDNPSLIKIEQIKAEIKGAHIAGIGRVDMENLDHVLLAAYLLGKTEAANSHHKELMNTLGLFG